MARLLTFWVVLSLLTVGGGMGGCEAQAQEREQTARHELIIRLADEAPQALRQSLQEASTTDQAAALGPLYAGVVRSRPAFPEIESTTPAGPATWPVFVLELEDQEALNAAKASWTDQPGVLYVEENDFFELYVREGHETLPEGFPISTDPDSINAKLNHLDVIRAREAHRITRGTRDVTIGVIDSGVFYRHPDLESQVWVNEPEDVANAGTFVPGNRQGTDEDGNGWVDDVIGYSFVDRPLMPEPGRYGPRDPDPRPDELGSFSGHGTAVSGVVAAQEDNGSGMKGVAPGARIALLRAFGGDGRGRTRDIAAAVIYGAEMGFDVLNMSFGRDRLSLLLHDAIKYAQDAGTISVASAGNVAGDDPHYPSDYPEVISTVWLAEDGRGLPAFSTSSYGIGADLGAPGSNVFTTRYPRTVPDEEITPSDLYGAASGSSFAAPQVSGAVALLRSLDASLSPDDIRSILTSSTTDVGIPGWDHRTGAGLLDVYEALKRALPGNTVIAHPDHDSGWSAPEIPVIGSSIHPKHQSYQVSYTSGTHDLNDADWTPLHEPIARRVLDDTLVVWPVDGLDEGAYTLRLTTQLTDGRTVEDRRRVRIQRTPPTITVHAIEAGIVQSDFGLIADVSTDQRTSLTLRLARANETETIDSEFRRQRHGLYWSDTAGQGGEVAARVVATNDAGLSVSFDTTLTLPERRFRSQLLKRHDTSVPRGYLLPTLTDFDGDSLPELILNPLSSQGGISDSLYLYEWTGQDFVRGDSLQANVIPRDVGDTNVSGTSELLTQVGSATLLLEQEESAWLPKSQAFIDTTGVRGSEAPFLGSVLADLLNSGSAQILGHTREVWKGRAWDGSHYTEAFTLDPRDVLSIEDTLSIGGLIGPARAATGDFTGNGRTNLLVGDRYGHSIVYETPVGETVPVPIWTHASNRFDAGLRFGVGDLTGDGTDNFVTFTKHYPLSLPDDTRMPARSTYTVWTHTGNGFEAVYRLPIAGDAGPSGAVTTANLTGDDRDEVIIAHAPYLIVLRNDPAHGWQVAYLDDRAGIESTFSPALVVGDVTGSGRPDVFVTTRDDHVVRFAVQEQALAVPPPQWRRAEARSDSAVMLQWEAAGADSVSVFQRTNGSPFEQIAVREDSSLAVSTTTTHHYALRAWIGGEGSPLSETRKVRPRSPATVIDVSYPASNEVRLTFSEAISDATRAEQFAYEGNAVRRLVSGSNGQALVLTLPHGVPRTGTLTWRDVRDRDGTPVGQSQQTLALPAVPEAPFFVADWTRLSAQRVALEFNTAVDRDVAADPERYRVTPPGTVARAVVSNETDHRIVLDIDGLVVGATGRIITLRLDDLFSADGRALASESRAIQLTGPADNLDDVFVYPNPMRGAEHAHSVTIAGVPTEATVRVVSVDGRMVRTLTTDQAFEGGIEWDLEDETGRRVPTGVYYVRVEAPGESPVMKKAAVIW